MAFALLQAEKSLILVTVPGSYVWKTEKGERLMEREGLEWATVPCCAYGLAPSPNGACRRLLVGASRELRLEVRRRCVREEPWEVQGSRGASPCSGFSPDALLVLPSCCQASRACSRVLR